MYESCFIEAVKTWCQYLLHKLVLLFEKEITVSHLSMKKIHSNSKALCVNPWHFDIQITFHQTKSGGHIVHFVDVTLQLVLTL
jgi:hypothetical protein